MRQCQQEQKVQLGALEGAVANLADQMQDFIKVQLKTNGRSGSISSERRAKAPGTSHGRALGLKQPTRAANFTAVRGKPDRYQSNEKSRSRPRLRPSTAKNSKTAQRGRAASTSLSPDSKLRKKGAEFLSKIGSLKANLAVQGNAFDVLESELKHEHDGGRQAAVAGN